MNPALRAFLEAAVLPPGLLLLMALAALPFRKRHPVFSLSLVSTALLLLYLLSTPALAALLAAGLERNLSPLDLASLPAGPGAVVVPGCDRYPKAPEFGRDEVSACSLVRLRYAAEIATRTGLPVLLSGGSPRGETEPEAQIMARVLKERFGVQPWWLEGKSANTDENAHFSAAILARAGIHQIFLVTHAFHMRRAARSFRRYGLEVVPAPTYFYSTRARLSGAGALLPSAESLLISTLVLREHIALAWYLATGR